MELTIHERKVLFIIEVNKHRFDRSRLVVSNFIDYWTTFEDNDTFMKFEKCVRFGIKSRLDQFNRGVVI